jgi:threonine dehydratase
MRHVWASDFAPAEAFEVPWARVAQAPGKLAELQAAGLRKLRIERAQPFDGPGFRVWIASECHQVTGSFKVRGALWALREARDRGESAVVAASAGNHGAGVAYAAQVLRMHATVVVPMHAAQTKLAAMRSDWVQVLQVDGGYDEAEARARELARARGQSFLSPYDDEAVVLGNGVTIAFELVEQLGRVADTVLCPIGGGGLASGLAWGLGYLSEDRGFHQRRVWAAQSELSAAFALSMERRVAIEQLPCPEPTLAEGLEGGISPNAFQRAAACVRGVSVASEDQIAHAMVGLASHLGLGVEGSAAVALCPLLDSSTELALAGDVVVMVSGSNVDPATLKRAEQLAAARRP